MIEKEKVLTGISPAAEAPEKKTVMVKNGRKLSINSRKKGCKQHETDHGFALEERIENIGSRKDTIEKHLFAEKTGAHRKGEIMPKR